MVTSIEIDEFTAFTIGIVVYFLGVNLTKKINFLREFNIPEPVTGGIAAALVTLAVYAVLDVSVAFNLDTRDRLLVYFFTTIGLDARFADLLRGGKQLLILLCLTVGYIVVQNGIGMAGATIMDFPSSIGVLTGSASLIGGHGTAIAWAPEIASRHGIPNAMELGIASATFGLILASLIGGPIAKYLIDRKGLTAETGKASIVGLPYKDEERAEINHKTFMGALLALHIAIILGYLFNIFLEAQGVKLPLFVSCLLMAIILSNTVPYVLPKLRWPARTPALAVIADFSLNTFLAMSLMSMQLWTLAGLAGPLLLILALQAVGAAIFIIFVLFPLMGRNYEAAVLSAGFGGFALGATPTAIANMTAVSKKYGPAPNAFIILPLVAAFFVDIANSFIINMLI